MVLMHSLSCQPWKVKPDIDLPSPCTIAIGATCHVTPTGATGIYRKPQLCVHDCLSQTQPTCSKGV